jgi:transcriptional regulator with XRE-family HTH domain|uniref:Helix-turn-helix domain protein n=1 Tax=Siphoviridae sp. ctNHj22 TaxID=2825468 RepID=A0A8S5VFL7_9CAUD|nr:MAG TPA: helix-turn-helix domain protein [Siphoviridae sp. ctNHj22]
MRNVERAKQIAKSKGISFAFVCTQIGKSRGYLAEILANGRDIPEKMLEPVAQALGVPVEELTGESEQKEKPAPQMENGLDAKAQATLNKMKKLSPEQQAAFWDMLNTTIDAVLNMPDGDGNG